MKTVAFIQGKFDPICTKHLEIFSELREKYDFISVLVESDENTSPTLNLSGRIKVLNSLNTIDDVSVYCLYNLKSLEEKYKQNIKDYTLLSDGEIYIEQPTKIQFVYLTEENYTKNGEVNEEKDKHHM